jgi:hypothetical protein
MRRDVPDEHAHRVQDVQHLLHHRRISPCKHANGIICIRGLLQDVTVNLHHLQDGQSCTIKDGSAQLLS